MATSQGLFLAIFWILLRFGLPVLGTGLLIWFFNRLDSRWKQEAVSRRKTMFAEGVIPFVKCWIFHDCAPERRSNCPAFQEKNVPCWQLFRDANENLQDKCLGCEVFQTAPLLILDH